jgi:hypothetical protein
MTGLPNGALNSRAGNVTIAQTKASAPWTAIPTSRNGSSKSHTKGYRINASRANGQHRIKRMHHSRNVNITVPPAFSNVRYAN